MSKINQIYWPWKSISLEIIWKNVLIGWNHSKLGLEKYRPENDSNFLENGFSQKLFKSIRLENVKPEKDFNILFCYYVRQMIIYCFYLTPITKARIKAITATISPPGPSKLSSSPWAPVSNLGAEWKWNEKTWSRCSLGRLICGRRGARRAPTWKMLGGPGPLLSFWFKFFFLTLKNIGFDLLLTTWLSSCDREIPDAYFPICGGKNQMPPKENGMSLNNEWFDKWLSKSWFKRWTLWHLKAIGRFCNLSVDSSSTF